MTDVQPLPEHMYGAAVALWQQTGLTRPWNDPDADLRRAMTGNEALQARTQDNAGEIAEEFDRASPHLAEVRNRHLLSIGDLLPVPPAVLPATTADLLKRQHLSLRLTLDHIFEGRLHGTGTSSPARCVWRTPYTAKGLSISVHRLLWV